MLLKQWFYNNPENNAAETLGCTAFAKQVLLETRVTGNNGFSNTMLKKTGVTALLNRMLLKYLVV